MKSVKNWSVAVTLVLFSLLGVEAAVAQTDRASNESVTVAASTVSVDSTSSEGGSSDTPDTKASAKKDYYQDPDRLKVSIYPVYGYAPIFGASFKFPNLPTLPILPGGSANSGNSFNGAAFFGFAVQKKRFYFAADLLWAELSASRTIPIVDLPMKTNLDTLASHGHLGYKFYKDFYITGGFRELGLKYGITIGAYPEFQRKPRLWDPLLGMMWMKQMSKKWKTKIDFEGGGFGVGANSDISLQGQAEWQFAKHFGLLFGYGLFHLDVSHTIANQEFDVNQTLNGPLFGFGIYF